MPARRPRHCPVPPGWRVKTLPALRWAERGGGAPARAAKTWAREWHVGIDGLRFQRQRCIWRHDRGMHQSTEISRKTKHICKKEKQWWECDDRRCKTEHNGIQSQFQRQRGGGAQAARCLRPSALGLTWVQAARSQPPGLEAVDSDGRVTPAG
eukprot:gene15065-biopygen11193